MNHYLGYLCDQYRDSFTVVLRIVIFILFLAGESSGNDDKRVLFISSYHPAFPTFFQQIEGIKSVIGNKILLDIEFMDTKRYPQKENLEDFRKSLSRKLGDGREYNVIVVADDNALIFALEQQDKLFKDKPIVFLGVNDIDRAMAQNDNNLVTGVVEAVSMKETIDLMIRLRPQSNRIVAIVDNTPSGQGDLKSFYRVSSLFKSHKFEEISLANMSWPEFLKSLRGLTEKNCVLLLSAYKDNRNKTFLFDESLWLIRNQLKPPIFHLWRHGLGDGILGGKVISHFEQGKAAGNMVLKILAGEPVSRIPVVDTSPNRYIIDYSELKRYGISTALLPDDSLILNRPYAFYYENKTIIWLITSVFIVFSVALFSALVNILRRKQVEKALKSQRDRLEYILEGTNVGTWEWNIQTGETIFNERWANIIGYTLNEIAPNSIETWLKYVHPQDLEKSNKALEKHFRGESDYYEIESRMKHKSGHWVWVLDRGKVISRAEDGKPLWMYGTHQDITDRKQNDDAMRRSSEKYRTILQTSVNGFWMTDAEGHLLEVNDAYCCMSGYSEKELLSMHISELEADMGPKEIKAKINLIMELYHDRFETRHRRKDGSIYDVEVASKYLPGGDGGGRFFIFLHDISERKKSDKILRSLSETWKLAQKAANIGHWRYDLNTRQSVWSDQMYKVLGCDPGKGVPGHEAHRQIIHSDDWDMFDKAVEGAINGTPYNIEMRTVFPDGTLHWCNAQGVPRRDPDGNVIELFGTTQDITERKQAELLLRESESKMRSILDNAGIGVALISPEMKVLELNKRMREWFPDIDLEQHPICYRVFNDPPRESECDYCPTCKTLQDGKVHESTTYTPRPEGIRNYRLVTSPIFDPSGRIVGVIEITEDITEKLSLELQLRQAQKMESIGRLAGGVAHDFNNMLGVILGYGELALEHTKPAQKLHTYLQEIMKAARNSAEITRQLLAFARKQTISPKMIDINKTVAGMNMMLKRLIGEDIDLSWLPGKDVWPLMIDPGQIDQLLVNLCVNARDAITDVGKITIETGNTEFDEAYCKDHAGFIPGEYVFLAISDNGHGMDAKALEKIFDPFFTTKETGKGTGLGLATVYGIVKQNDGFINAYSEPGQGTTMSIYLPRHQTDTQVLSEKEKSYPDVHGQGMILLVEDEPAILGMTTLMLEELGYTVTAARTPGEAIAFSRKHNGEILLLLTDVVMPEMTGRDLAKNILSTHPYIKRLFMSGYTANVIAHHGVLDEGVNFIQKPFSKEQLGVKIREALEKDNL